MLNSVWEWIKAVFGLGGDGPVKKEVEETKTETVPAPEVTKGGFYPTSSKSAPELYKASKERFEKSQANNPNWKKNKDADASPSSAPSYCPLSDPLSPLNPLGLTSPISPFNVFQNHSPAPNPEPAPSPPPYTPPASDSYSTGSGGDYGGSSSSDYGSGGDFGSSSSSSSDYGSGGDY